MTLRRTSHAVYDTLYHLVWCPKYRKRILQGDVGLRVHDLFYEIAEDYGITIIELHVAVDHVHLLCSFPPKDSIVQVVTRFKSISAKAVFREFPMVKKQLWKNNFWETGYFVRTVGDGVTAQAVQRYITNHHPAQNATPDDLRSLFEDE